MQGHEMVWFHQRALAAPTRGVVMRWLVCVVLVLSLAVFGCGDSEDGGVDGVGGFGIRFAGADD